MEAVQKAHLRLCTILLSFPAIASLPSFCLLGRRSEGGKELLKSVQMGPTFVRVVEFRCIVGQWMDEALSCIFGKRGLGLI